MNKIRAIWSSRLSYSQAIITPIHKCNASGSALPDGCPTVKLCFRRVFIASPAGRKRFNVLGAVNAITQEVITVTNESYINAQSICQMLLKLHALGLNVPITVVLDNARYQKCQVVFGLAKALDIELLYLPSYSPHLNLIERLWKFVRNQCLYSKYYAEFDDFKQAIDTCLQQANTTHKKSLETLLSLNFQSFKNVHLLDV